jgi:hypothetical protein
LDNAETNPPARDFSAPLGRPRSGRASSESWVQITLCVIVAALLLVVAAIPHPASQHVDGVDRRTRELRLALADLRAAIADYELDHSTWPGRAPDAPGPAEIASSEWFERQLTGSTGPRGELLEAGADETAPRFGPYLPFAVPIDPINGLSTVRVLDANEPWPERADGTTGWLYRLATGEIRANAVGAAGDAGVRYYQL